MYGRYCSVADLYDMFIIYRFEFEKQKRKFFNEKLSNFKVITNLYHRLLPTQNSNKAMAKKSELTIFQRKIVSELKVWHQPFQRLEKERYRDDKGWYYWGNRLCRCRACTLAYESPTGRGYSN